MNSREAMPDHNKQPLFRQTAAQKTFMMPEPGGGNALGLDLQKSFCFFFFRKRSSSSLVH
jgi:hypothetical protein